jgi:hypothetical protein
MPTPTTKTLGAEDDILTKEEGLLLGDTDNSNCKIIGTDLVQYVRTTGTAITCSEILGDRGFFT